MISARKKRRRLRKAEKRLSKIMIARVARPSSITKFEHDKEIKYLMDIIEIYKDE